MQPIIINESITYQQYQLSIVNNQTFELLIALLINYRSLLDLCATFFVVGYIWLWNCKLDKKIRGRNLTRLELYVGVISSAYIFQAHTLQSIEYSIYLVFISGIACSAIEFSILLLRLKKETKEIFKYSDKSGLFFQATKL